MATALLHQGHVRYYPDLAQGSPEWIEARRGLLTASEMKLIITPGLKVASNDKERAHLFELLAQRITGHVEPHYISDDMLRGQEEEIDARILYAQRYAPVHDVGFITNDRHGFILGYSPDGLVGERGQIECKSRRQKYQVQTIVENMGDDRGETIPADYVIQIQTGLLVSERQWCDFVSYSGGLPMAVVRCHPIPAVQEAILNAAGEFEARLAKRFADYHAALEARADVLIPTERKIEEEITL
jgi:predicted phage-related endonuclease